MLDSIGFIGLGTMGEPMCRNLITKSNQPVIAFDVRSEPLERLRSDGVKIADSIGDLCSNSHTLSITHRARGRHHLLVPNEGALCKSGACL